MAAFVVEVSVDIGHRFAVRIQESFEQQLVLNRINVGDANAIGHCTAGCRPAARSDKYSNVFAVVDKIGHDQEVTRKAHCFHRMQFKIEPFFDFGGDYFVLFACAFIGQVAQILILRLKFLRHYEIGQ